MSRLYPISLNLSHKLCIVIGGGKIATRKIYTLLGCNAIVKVVAPTIQDELKVLLQGEPNLTWIQTPYGGIGDLEGAYLVFAATDNPLLNEHIYNDASKLKILANVASNGVSGDFIVPSSFNQGDLQVSVSTSGKVPGLSKSIGKQLQEQFDPKYAILIDILDKVRLYAISAVDNKADNLTVLADIVQNYTNILTDLHAGISPDDMINELLKKFISL